MRKLGVNLCLSLIIVFILLLCRKKEPIERSVELSNYNGKLTEDMINDFPVTTIFLTEIEDDIITFTVVKGE